MFTTLHSPLGRKNSGLRDTITASLAPWPDGTMKQCCLPNLHRADNGASLSFRRRSHQATICSILPRQPGQSHHSPWQNGQSEGDFLPAGLQGRAGYQFPGKPGPRNKGKKGASLAPGQMVLCEGRHPAPVHSWKPSGSLPRDTETVPGERVATVGRIMTMTTQQTLCHLLKFLDEA